MQDRDEAEVKEALEEIDSLSKAAAMHIQLAIEKLQKIAGLEGVPSGVEEDIMGGLTCGLEDLRSEAGGVSENVRLRWEDKYGLEL